ncbi:MAG: hypothetical protein EBR71_02340 [Planctomycetes bacterium]|nr:hypothetical protein [Planctomycetota bacterium]
MGNDRFLVKDERKGALLCCPLRPRATPADAAEPLKNPDGDPAGSWCETDFTGTGFPKVFYLRYHMYRLYFPLMAMGRFVQAREAGA